MRRIIAGIVVLGGVLSVGGIGTAADPDPTGLWLTENERSVIRIARCDRGLCGEIAWIIEGGMRRDSANPDPAKRDRPMCGLSIMWGFEQDADNPAEWEGGEIYKADDGDVYNANLEVLGPQRLKVRGYIGLPLFGKSQTWTRVSAGDYPACTPPSSDA